MINILKDLCHLPGISGGEHAVRDYIIHEIKDYVNYSVDSLGNIIAYKKGKNTAHKKIMLDAHMDEVGFIITYINDDGTLSFSPVGGINPSVVFGRRVRIGKIYGVIGGKPVHSLSAEERKNPPKFSDMRIDIGAKDKQEALLHVKPAALAVFDSEFYEFGDGLVKARALDDRAGCAVLIDIIKSETEYDLVFTFTVQEEVGTRGAKTAAYTVDPYAAIVVETTTAADIAGVSKGDSVCALGRGSVLSFMDSGSVYDRELYEIGFQTADEIEVLCQPKAAVAGGNNAAAVHVSRSGVRTAAVSLPCRYLHSGSCVIAKSDLYSTSKLVKAMAEKLASGKYF